MKFDEFHKSIGNPDILALSLELDSCDWLRIMVAIKGRVLALNLWGLNQDDPDLDWSDNSEVQQYLMFKNKDFKDVLRIQAHIRYRENHEGWIFKTSGDPDNPVVKLIGLN